MVYKKVYEVRGANKKGKQERRRVEKEEDGNNAAHLC